MHGFTPIFTRCEKISLLRHGTEFDAGQRIQSLAATVFSLAV
jgi:hypothetical protein